MARNLREARPSLLEVEQREDKALPDLYRLEIEALVSPPTQDTRDLFVRVPYGLVSQLLEGAPLVGSTGKIASDSYVVAMLGITDAQLDSLNEGLDPIWDRVRDREAQRVTSVEIEGDQYFELFELQPDAELNGFLRRAISEVSEAILGHKKGGILSSLLLSDRFYRPEKHMRRISFSDVLDHLDSYGMTIMMVERHDVNHGAPLDGRADWGHYSTRMQSISGPLSGRYDHIIDLQAWHSYVAEQRSQKYELQKEAATAFP